MCRTLWPGAPLRGAARALLPGPGSGVARLDRARTAFRGAAERWIAAGGSLSHVRRAAWVGRRGRVPGRAALLDLDLRLVRLAGANPLRGALDRAVRRVGRG